MKRSQIKRRPLADSVLTNLEPDAKEYQEKDSPNLYFRVKPNGTKSWMLRYKRPNGSWAWKGLGGFPSVSGKIAREKAHQILKDLSNGVDIAKPANNPASDDVLFRTVGDDWYRRKVVAGRSHGSLKQYKGYLEKDIYPVLGDLGLKQITRADCAKIQANLEARGSYVIAAKIRRWLTQIFSLAIGQGLLELNPASELRQIAQEGIKEKQYPHLLEDELPAFLKALRRSRGTIITLTLVRLVLRTASRPGSARRAEWSEMDLDNGVWTIPAPKMKTRVAHVVPLAQQTVEELRKLHERTGLNQYVFPGSGQNAVISEVAINKALQSVGYRDKLVGHGCRHTASTLLHEHGWDHHVIEAQLAHKVQGVAGVYNKAVYLEQRKKMMQWYADYLDKLEKS
jgi:integrase